MSYAATTMLRDGTRLTIRAARPDDRERVTRAFAGLDPDSVYMRFFGYRSGLTDAELRQLDAQDPAERAILLATVAPEGEEVVVGSGSYVRIQAGDARSAEVAFAVEEDYQGRGIAGRLLDGLVTVARANRIARFEATVLEDNRAMLAVFERSRLPMRTRREEGTVVVTLDLSPASVWPLTP